MKGAAKAILAGLGSLLTGLGAAAAGGITLGELLGSLGAGVVFGTAAYYAPYKPKG